MAELQTGDPKNVPSWILGVKIVGHCRDCKHWYRDSTFGYSGYAECKLANTVQGLFQVVGQDWDGFLTEPDFGCIQFEAKESE